MRSVFPGVLHQPEQGRQHRLNTVQSLVNLFQGDQGLCIGGGRRSCGTWLRRPLTLSDRCDGDRQERALFGWWSVPFLKEKERLQVKNKDRRDGFVLLSRQMGSKQVGVGLYHPSS